MRLFLNRAARVAPLVLSAATMLLACRDSSTTVRTSGGGDNSNLSPIAGASAPAIRARERIHEKNRYDWVGAAHNKALDDFRRELRRPGVLTRNLCEYAQSFAAREERNPRDRALSESDRWSITRTVGDSVAWCGRRGPRVSNTTFTSPFAPSPVPTPQSQQAYEFLGAIEAAVNEAQSSFDLAERLDPLLDRMAALDPIDQAVVGATISVTQSSYEYWETQLTAYHQELLDEYGGCVNEQSSSGGDPLTVRDNCLNDQGDGAVAFKYPPVGPFSGRLTGLKITPSCAGSLREGVGKVVSADLKGAFTGAVSGGIAAGLAGVVGGAIAGATAGSTWAAIENAWEVFKCIYRL
jgi:hypothetical protein